MQVLMAEVFPRILADDRGVWREDRPGERAGIPWDEITCVSGYKLDGISTVATCVVLDWGYGEFLELYDRYPGFTQVVDKITQRLPGIEPDWYSHVEALRTTDSPVELWPRG